MQRWWNIWWWWWDMEWKRVESVNKKVEDRRGEAEMALAFGTVVWCLRVCLSMCVSLHPFSACLCGRCSLWESESSLTLPHNAYLQLASLKNTIVCVCVYVRVCVCNMKTKSLYKGSITGLWEVTVSSDDEQKRAPFLIILAKLNNWIQERTGSHAGFLHVYCRPAVMCSPGACLAVCCWVSGGDVRWQNRALSPMPPLLIGLGGGKLGERTGRAGTLWS